MRRWGRLEGDCMLEVGWGDVVRRGSGVRGGHEYAGWRTGRRLLLRLVVRGLLLGRAIVGVVEYPVRLGLLRHRGALRLWVIVWRRGCEVVGWVWEADAVWTRLAVGLREKAARYSKI